MALRLLFLLAVLLTVLAFAAAPASSSFIVGVGSADATGPACDVNFMGYANPSQIAAGIHFRQRARAFVVQTEDKKSRGHRIAYVSVDFGMGSQAVTRRVLELLDERYPKGTYTLANLFISGTHTHSAPGGYDQYAIDQLASGGFVPEVLEAYSQAVFRSITKAHDSAKPGRRIRFGTGQAEPHTNINRSPTSYLQNPREERALYDADTEQYFSLLRFEDNDKSGSRPLGMFNWYAVHATSMPNTNLLISGDNKGYASQLFEHWMDGPEVLPGRGSFVAGFASSNLGDVSPNVNGTFCKFSGLPCNELHSTCHGLTEFCLGRGPGSDAFDSTRIIGERQARAALRAFQDTSSTMKEVDASGGVVSRHRVVDFANVTVESTNAAYHSAIKLDRLTGVRSLQEDASSPSVRTCKSALGYAFAAGTTDGPGVFDFYQGEVRGNKFWETIRNFIKKPTAELVQCHAPKPVLLPTGEIDFPYAWEPSVMSIGLALVGRSVALLSVPAEFSTMAGRRLKRLVKDRLVAKRLLNKDGVVVLSCLTNAYAHYVVTFEEYQMQRYEAASTLFGPHTLAAYIQEFFKLVDDDDQGKQSQQHVIPNLVPKAITVLRRPGVDKLPRGAQFGGLVRDVAAAAGNSRGGGSSVVSAVFHSANLRHDYRHEDSFLTVDRLDPATGQWTAVLNDSSFETKLRYYRSKEHSTVEVEWHVAASTVAGTYRLSHSASYMDKHGKLHPFTGYSRAFEIE